MTPDFNPNETRHSIVVNCPTLKTTISRFTAITLGESIRSPANELISRNEITALILVTAESSLTLRKIPSSFHVGGALPSTGKKTQLTQWNHTVSGRRKFSLYNRRQQRALSQRLFISLLPHEFLNSIHTDAKFPMPQK